MANTKQARKRVKTDAERRDRNRSVRSAYRTEVKRFLRLVKDGELEAAGTHVRVVESKLDKAAKRNILHHRTADRMKSRLKTRLFKASAEAK